ncbi:serine hydrolase domain-containing protein [Flavihumibacter solisilvae]|uniref:Beta-lactamase-related domain-containing protein n=1 Tax=Flavihumibacter solisilvae TaxID=1349421 RepID=A0A0C1INF8_9BACT|nr:serine hydrolase domain-containing protein [Flavihumibacter solisilvae]KIC95780.1 hypothetical protein OI18_03835 [Flavihumibacter solisilvae]
MKQFLSVTLLLCLLGYKLTAQSLPDSTVKKIDSIFAKYSKGNSPGCTVGIVRNDSIIFAKGYGLANLEYEIPNQPTTIYHMASVSKQFTGYAIVLLVRQGKLKLEDDVRKYLTWFPDLKHTITIRHLLNHTSGIRDQWQLLAISGTRLTDVIKQEHIVKLLSKQQALNSPPGEQYNYSNSGYTMLAEIVKSVTGQTLRQFTDSAIFKPLGMTATHFHDDNTEIVKNRSYSYDQVGNDRYENSPLNYSNAGATSLFTNIPDLGKWVMNFYRYKVGDQRDISLLTTRGKLNNGKELNYALGISVDTYKGWRQYSHSGGDAGYRTYLAVLPDLQMGFMVFGNLGDFDAGGSTYAMMDLLVKDTATKKAAAAAKPRDSIAAMLRDTNSTRKYVGSYIGDDGLSLSFEIRNRRLYYQVYGETNFLIRENLDTFSIAPYPDIRFAFAVNGKDTLVDIIFPDKLMKLKKYVQASKVSDDILKQYTGLYYSPELDCKYGISLKDNKLFLTNSKYSDSELTLINSDHLTSGSWYMNHLQVLRDATNKITGFEVNSGRIMHLKFNKIE